MVGALTNGIQIRLQCSMQVPLLLQVLLLGSKSGSKVGLMPSLAPWQRQLTHACMAA